MTATAALRSGLIEAWRRPRLVGGLFLLNVVWAVVSAWPFYTQLLRATERRPFAAALTRGLDYDVLAEVVRHHPAITTAAAAGALVGLLGWVALSWFLTAGVLGLLRLPARDASLLTFATAAAARGFAMARIQLWSLATYAAATVVTAGLGALGAWLGSYAVSPWPAVWAGAIGAVPGLLLWLWVTTAVDVARARAALSDERSMRRVLWRALREVPRRPRRFLTVQLAGAALWLVASGLYLALARRSAFGFAGGLVLLTALREALVLVRTWLRLGVLGGTLALAEDR